MRRFTVLFSTVAVAALVAWPASAQEGRWTLRLQAGGMRASGESISVYNGPATEECLQFAVQGHCWVTNRYLLEEDAPLAGLALAYRVAPQWGVEATVWHGSTRLRAEREGWPCSERRLWRALSDRPRRHRPDRSRPERGVPPSRPRPGGCLWRRAGGLGVGGRGAPLRPRPGAL